jgi:drug/metabolite transporter (DMT)-like permease
VNRSEHAPSRHEAETWAMFVGLTLAWGASFLFIKIGLNEGLEPFTLVAWRMTLATLFLGGVLLVTRGRIPRAPGALGRLALLGVLNVALPALLLTWGSQSIPSALASILNGLQPLFAVVLAALVLHDEPMTVDRLLGLLVGFGGAVLLVSPNLTASGPDVSSTDALLGEIAVALAALSYAVAAVYARRFVTGARLVDEPAGGRRRATASEIALAQVATGAIIAVTLAAITEHPDGGVIGFPPTPTAWGAVLWVGVLGSGVAYLLFFRIMRAWGAMRTTLVTYGLPVMGIALGVIVLDERLHPEEIAGTALVLTGLVLASTSRRSRILFARRPPAAG